MLRQGVPLAGIPTPTRPGAPGGQGFGLSPFSPPQGGPGKGQGQRKKPSFRGSPQEQRCICFSHVRLFATLWTVAHQVLCLWDSPDKSIQVGSQALLQGIALTQGSNLQSLCPLYWQAGSLPLAPLGKLKSKDTGNKVRSSKMTRTCQGSGDRMLGPSGRGFRQR